MTKEAILNFVREIQDNEAILDFVSAVIDAAETLAKATQAEERERCARIAEDENIRGIHDQFATDHENIMSARKAVAVAIRKDRGCDPPQAETK